jgi:translation initiation factor 5
VCLFQPSKRYVSKEVAQQIRDKAKPVIDWLEQASSEEEDDDDDEEEEEVT